jgi:hypothetical protein
MEYLNFSLGCTSVTCMSAEVPSRQLNIQYLDLTDCLGLSDEGLHTVVQTCPALNFLYLRRCVMVSGEFSSLIIWF